MTTTFKYSPSVNIKRDQSSDLNYIPTPNAIAVFNRFVNDFLTGIKSFYIIGAYGIGKSAFLWALEKTLTKEKNYFGKIKNKFNEVMEFEFINIIGEYNSIIDTFCKVLQIDINSINSTYSIIQKIDEHYTILKKSRKGLGIIIDEFGKFLEYAAKNNPEKELYFIQEIAEFIKDKDIFFITTLHQDFNAYSFELTRSQRYEWDKVKGRLKELTFNEPVEQLLFLAAERVNKLFRNHKPHSNLKSLYNIIKKSKTFPLRDYFTKDIAQKLFPFDILSASILTLALQKYGQNERSLFTFIESNDPLGIRSFNFQKAQYYNICNVYDYLFFNYHSFLTSKYNPHFIQWNTIKNSLDRTEGLFKKNIDEAFSIIKTIGLLTIFSSASASINNSFLDKYGKYTLGIKNPLEIVKNLEKHKILRYVEHKSSYQLFEGTDLDIELAIDNAGNLVEKISNVVFYLNQYFNLNYILAKAHYYKTGTPRIFKFKLTEEPIVDFKSEQQIDGYINLIFSESINENDIRNISSNCNDAILYGFYKKTNEIKNLIYEIEKIKKVKENNIEDKVAVSELDSILNHQINLLNHYVIDNIYTNSSNIKWFYQEKNYKIENRKNLNRILSDICDDVYCNAPTFHSELINKNKLSPPVSTAKKNLLSALLTNWDQKDLGFQEDKYPPEKTIYLSLIKSTGIHKVLENYIYLDKPDEKSFIPVWKACEKFLSDSVKTKKNLKDLISKLSAKPFGLKSGFINFWLPIWLFVKRNDYALYNDNTFIPELSVDIFDLILKRPDEYFIKSFDLGGLRLELFNKYRRLINKDSKDKINKQTFIETIKPFLVFYKSLPNYSRKTRRLSEKTIRVRDVIVNAKDLEQTFFEDFPNALGYTTNELNISSKKLEDFLNDLKDSIRELNSSYTNLINRIESALKNEFEYNDFDFPEYKKLLQKRYSLVKKYTLLQNQKTILQRINSTINGRESWLNSLVQSLINKKIDTISDEDEEIIYDKIQKFRFEFDNLCEFANLNIDNATEEAIKFEIQSLNEGFNSNVIRLPKKQHSNLKKIEHRIKKELKTTHNKKEKIYLLLKILREELNEE